MNKRAFRTNLQKPLKWEKALEILDQFDHNVRQYVDDRVYDPQGGDLYIFYNTNPEKQDDYKVDGYLWRNNGANKLVPKETLTRKPQLTKSYYLAIDKEKVFLNIFKSLFHITN